MKRLLCCVAIAAALAASAGVGAQAPPEGALPGEPAAAPALPAAPVLRPLPPSRWTAAQIRQSFELADSDGNGELTRAEAQQLTIKPRSFEEMDENKDGVVSRGEYEDQFAR